MTTEILKVAEDAGVLTLTFSRPELFNSFNAELGRAFLAALENAKNSRSVRVVLITGSGKAFCSGQDLAELCTPDADGNLPDIAAIVERFNDIARVMRALPKPIVCAVNGPAAGAGSSIALAADFVLAAESSYLMQSFIHVGLIPDTGGTFLLPRLVGIAKANELVMLGEKLSAKDAQSCGLIYKVCPDASLLTDAKALADRLATLAPMGLSLAKQALRKSLENNFEAQLELEKELQIRLSKSADYKEGVQAFMEKRQAHFKGE